MKQLLARLIKPSSTNGDVLTTVSGKTAWAAATGGGATTLDALTDVDTTTTPPTTGQVLKFNGTLWTPAADAGGSGGGGASSLVSVDDPARWTANLGYDVEFDTDDLTGTLPSGWSWVNQGTATYLQQYGAGVIDAPGQAGDAIRGIVRAIPTQATWTATAKIALSAADVTNVATGIMLRDSVSGKIQTAEIQRAGRQTYVNNWTSATAYSSSPAGPITPLAPPAYVRVRKNGTTSWDAHWSVDGVGWYKLMTANNITTFLTPDQIGVFVYKNGVSQAAAGCHWFRVR